MAASYRQWAVALNPGRVGCFRRKLVENSSKTRRKLVENSSKTRRKLVENSSKTRRKLVETAKQKKYRAKGGMAQWSSNTLEEQKIRV
jgi:hypothetical protein